MSALEQAEALRQEGLAHLLENRIEEALASFDAGLSIATDEEQRELLTLNKAGALITLEQDGPEVQKLPQILMRRRSPRHAYLAASYLRRRHQIAKEYGRATFYGKIALDIAENENETGWKSEVLITLGNLCVFDSRTDEAIGYYSEALELLEQTPENRLRRGIALQDLGYCRMIEGDADAGVAMIHEAIALLRDAGSEGYLAESYIDLCYGYLELGDFETSRHYGELGLEQAWEVRQVRNAHYLLGELAYKSGDIERAEAHFDHLATHYPDFPQLKNLLLAIDLRKLVNFKL